MAISKTQKAKLKLSQPNNCWYCGDENPDTIDHVKPVSKGGSDNLDNLVLSCKSCNSSKKNYSISEYKWHCVWKLTPYSSAINSTDAKKLIKMGVVFDGIPTGFKFWFERYL